MLSDFLAGTVPGWMVSARREAVRRERAAPCCKPTFLLAQMCADAGCHGAAQRHFTTVAQLAEAAGDQLMRAVVLRAMGTLAFSQGRRRSAMDYLEASTAAVTSGDDARAVRAYLQAQLAETTQAGDQLAHYPRQPCPTKQPRSTHYWANMPEQRTP
ncbi:tetratricopeptide repeat protein [Streptomyces roseoverticillatus]|uniref:tetratricopeptide repeat protein n=1 Tax=Streptomyces roseoverticillatus TaxID=66429 RepID=UPI001F2DCFB1|nr:tetratricopeptide repeat protein [Streptomyces roseoverticillatus]MCF3103120.1 tetratricopeptide repeat protein [Streptomyces roseoverticillatus]